MHSTTCLGCQEVGSASDNKRRRQRRQQGTKQAAAAARAEEGQHGIWQALRSTWWVGPWGVWFAGRL